MAKRISIILLLLVVIGAGAFVAYHFLASPKQQLSAIPKNAAVVVKADFKTMATKLNTDKLKEFKMFKDFGKPGGGEKSAQQKFMEDILSNPLSTGVNIISEVYGFSLANASGQPKAGLVFGVLSSSKLEATVKKIPGDYKIDKGTSFDFVKLEDGASLAWNDKRGLILVDPGEDAKAYAASLLAQDEKESILSDAEFGKFLGARADVGCFINLAEVGKYSQTSTLADQLKAGGNQKFGLLLNFEHNKVTLESDYYGDKASRSEAQLILGSKGLTDDIMKTVTDKVVLAETSISVDKKKVLALAAKSDNYNSTMSMAGMQMGLTKDDLEQLLGNQLDIAVIGTKEIQVPNGEGGMNNNLLPILTASMNIGNTATLHKVLDQLHLPKISGYYSMHMNDMINVDIVETNAGVTFTNDNTIAEKLADKKQFDATPQEPVAGIMHNNPFSMYVSLDENSYPESARNYLKATTGDVIYGKCSNVLKEFKDFQVRSDNDKCVVELNMTDGPDNSLFRLMSIINNASQLQP